MSGGSDAGGPRRGRRRREADPHAEEAARRFDAGTSGSIESAIDATASRHPEAPRPTANHVRRHLRGLAEERLGREGYLQWQAEVLRRGLEVMEGLEGERVTLAGRAAQGLLDGDPSLHLRVETNRSIGELAAVLVERGFPEPEFDSMKCMVGRLDRLCFDDDGVEVSLVRCPPAQVSPGRRDLVTGEPVAMLDEEGLRRAVDHLERGEDPF